MSDDPLTAPHLPASDPPTSEWRSEPTAAAASLVSSLPIDPAERPEVLVGAAFAGGLVAAMILKRLGR